MTKLPEAGAVASWSPTGLGIATGHNRLNRGFFDAIFTGNAKLLGEATMAGKQNLWASGANLDLLDTYLLFGDPATKIATKFTAVYDDYSIDEDQTLTLPQGTGVLANDLHPQDASLTATLGDDVANGSLSLTADGSFTYTPYPDFFGVDSFTYTAYDGSEVSNLATVTITVNNVNDAPMADNQSVVTDINTAIAITLTATDADGDVLVFFVQDDPIHGQLSGTMPNLVYTPDQDYFGSDQFTFVVYEGGSISSLSLANNRATTGTIFITINPMFELFLPIIIN
jgi:hypothetical protein